MEKILREETFKYKNRSFHLKLLKKSDGFYVYMNDEKTGKDVDMCTCCKFDVYKEIMAKENPKDPIDDIVNSQKSGVAMWVDKGLI